MHKTERRWSTQQLAIFAFVLTAIGHLVVRARAGCGKTTTIVEAVLRFAKANPWKKVVVCAFNTKIKDELVTRFAGSPVQVKTLHALGYGMVRKFWPGAAPEKDSQKGLRAQMLTDRACGESVPDAMKRLVTKLHNLAREAMPLARTGGDLIELALEFDLVPDEEWAEQGYTVERVADWAAECLRYAEQRTSLIDYADMVFLPVRHKWMYKWADLVVVDEAQDMNAAQLAIARGICKGRIMVVGDDRQAIYGFRGADSGSLDRLKTELRAHELGLTTTYRCGHAIVERAAELVPDFEAGPANHPGEVLTMWKDRLEDAATLGDFILSRANAPLVATAIGLLRAGKRTRIAGRNIGDALIKLVQKLGGTARSVPHFLERLEAWETKQAARAAKGAKTEEAAAAKADVIHDQADMLRSLAENADGVDGIVDRIKALFTDDGLGQAGVITCSSVHRAKGLEARRVFVLADTLRSHNQEELNIQYVAITRAQETLVMVHELKEAR